MLLVVSMFILWLLLFDLVVVVGSDVACYVNAYLVVVAVLSSCCC